MKKIIALLTLTLAFSLNANAQDATKASAEKTNASSTKSKNTFTQDIETLSKLVNLNDGLKNDLSNLLVMRTEAVNNATNETDKRAIFEKFSIKFQGGLTPEQLQKFKMNTELYDRIILYNGK